RRSRTLPFLSFKQCQLCFFSPADIACGPEPFGYRSVWLSNRHSPRKRPAQGAVCAEYPMLQFKGGTGANRFVDCRHHVGLVVGMDVFVQPCPSCRLRVGDKTPSPEMPHLTPIRAHPVNNIRTSGHQCAKPRLAVAQCGGFGLLLSCFLDGN